MKTRRELFKNLRTEMKTSVLNDCKEDLILISKYILKVYKRYNKLGKYLNICIMDNAITINNAYYDNDKDFPIVICFEEGRD